MKRNLLFHPASVYFRYLKGLGLNFRTERDVESEISPLLSRSEKERKIGRNDPCPCGSGKKYKKCCMKK
jgi:SEC-C motif-containing protein